MAMIRHSLVERKNWENIAVIDGDEHFSYHDLRQKAIAIQQRLPRNRGENIAIFLPNDVHYIAAFYGVVMAGMTAFPLSVQLTVHEVASLLKQASASVVITSTEYRSFFEEIAKTVPVQALFVEELPEPEHGPVAEDIGADETMILLATSGTTGSAKIVQLTERNVESSSLAYISKMDYEKLREIGIEIRYTPGTPFSSSYGLLIITVCILQSIPLVIIKESFTLDALYAAAQKHRITHYEGGVSVGQLMEQTAGRPVHYDISSLRYFGLAGSMITSGTLRNLIEAYPGIEFWPGYGMTEAGPLIAKPDKKVNMDKLDAVGTKIDCVTIMLDVDGTLTDTPLAKGEIVVKGPNVMPGYYKNEEETRKILKDGFLYTGDIGYLDEDGYLYIIGRKKNLIIVRGFNVHPEEVEACIINSGLAKDCVVYGEADSSGDETVCADIVPVDPQVQPDGIRAYCAKHLASYKQPQKINIIEAIKKTATGKTERT